MTYEKHALIFKALSDPNRLKILDILKDGEKCVCRLLEELHLSQSTVSHHMKTLCDAELVKCRKDGKWSHYSINQSKLAEIQSFLT